MQKKSPSVIAVLGGQWGDEGKGKVIDLLSVDADLVIRAQGGANAGHNVVNNFGKFALHLIPSGIFNPNCLNIIGSGVALNPEILMSEIKLLNLAGVKTENLKISNKAHVTWRYLQLLDGLQESSKSGGGIGTTKQGVGPTLMAKMERIGIRAELFKDQKKLLKVLADNLSWVRQTLPKGYKVTSEFYPEYYENLIKKIARMLGPLVTDTEAIAHSALKLSQKIIVEGAHGSLLDIDHGTYPFVTSSPVTVAGLLQTTGIPPRYLTKSVGIFKAYQSRVGAGPMPSELKNQTGDKLREVGHEYGTTTGRPRRVGWFDTVAAEYIQRINGFSDIAITRLDILSQMDPAYLCIGYELKDEYINKFPATTSQLENSNGNLLIPFETGARNIKGYTKFDKLPQWAKNYLDILMRVSFPDAKLSYIGTGPGRDEIIKL